MAEQPTQQETLPAVHDQRMPIGRVTPMPTQVSPSAIESFQTDMQIASTLAEAGVFPSIKDAKRAYAALLIGRDLGMGPAEAMMSIDFGAQGKPSISAHWQAAQIRRRGHDYQIATLDSTQCMIHFLRRYNGELQAVGKVGMTMQDAQKISIHDKGQDGGGKGTLANKWNYRAWSEDMLYAYCMRRGVRRFYPELLMGYGGTEDEEQEGQEKHGVQDFQEPASPEQVKDIIDDMYGDDR